MTSFFMLLSGGPFDRKVVPPGHFKHDSCARLTYYTFEPPKLHLVELGAVVSPLPVVTRDAFYQLVNDEDGVACYVGDGPLASALLSVAEILGLVGGK